MRERERESSVERDSRECVEETGIYRKTRERKVLTSVGNLLINRPRRLCSYHGTSATCHVALGRAKTNKTTEKRNFLAPQRSVNSPPTLALSAGRYVILNGAPYFTHFVPCRHSFGPRGTGSRRNLVIRSARRSLDSIMSVEC